MSDLLKWKEGGLKSPTARARGLGAAHKGTHEWIVVRITSVALLFLTPWFALSAISLIGAGLQGFIYWLREPINATLMSSFLFVSYLHAKLGLQVIIEDYVHNEGAKIRELLALELLYWLALIVSLFSVLKIAILGELV